MSDSVSDTIQRLLQLNRLEDQLAVCHKWGDKGADDEALIESLRANISTSILVNHDRMRTRGKSSIAAVRHGVCSGCHMGLATGNFYALKRGDEIRRCGNCGRYLYVVDEENEPAPSPTPARPRRHVHDKSTATRSQIK